ncbi:MAG: di-trans,poly-cis-decaprenylcistransferase [Zoogloeaceae bacterium]|jgi:undecaprenyl diphosphate synthase|nr:di-trans,poly-cis-decaprenylcistransferase [Zoogloeaceae bacterium]
MAFFKSATREVPEIRVAPRHIAIIMDGNGRWAKKRFLPRVAGHVKGVETVREVVRACIEQGVEYLTLFAFSSENWRRPAEEISLLMQLFVSALEQEVRKLQKNGVRLKVIGDLSRFDAQLQTMIRDAETATADNTRLTLTIAANYGGRWDILQAMNRLAQEQPEKIGQWTETELEPWLATHFAPEPDLFIRTGGEERVSNFLLWQLAYTEFYFTETLWPEFDAEAMKSAIASYQRRERRFGRTSEQVMEGKA